MLIKTDSRNYTDIADAIREVTGSTKQYKPEEMEPALEEHIPVCGVSYDTFDSSGNVLTATIYGSRVTGLCGNSKLTSVTIPNTAVYIGKYGLAYTGLTNLELPGIFVIDDNAFYSSDITTITLSENTLKIGKWAFANCKNLILDSIPDRVTEISGYLFYNCPSIKEFIFHDKVSTISNNAFEDCVGLTTVTFKGTPTEIDSTVFDGCTNLITINVPWSEGEVANAPWGATNATINYNYIGE